MADQLWGAEEGRDLDSLAGRLGDHPAQNLQTLGTLIEELPCGVAILDLDGGVVEVSSNAAWSHRESATRLPDNLTTAWSGGKASPRLGWDLYPVLGRSSYVLVVDSEGIDREPETGPRLSKREHEIAVLVAGGNSNAEIARQLFVSPATVASHIGRILEKLEFRSRAQIAAWASRRLRPGTR